MNVALLFVWIMAARGPAQSPHEDLTVNDYNLARTETSICSTSKTKLADNQGAVFVNRDDRPFTAGRIKEALQAYSNAIEVDSDNATAYCDRGNTYFSRMQFDLAISDFTAAIDHSVAGELACINRGIAYSQQGELDLALADLNQVVRLLAVAERFRRPQ